MERTERDQAFFDLVSLPLIFAISWLSERKVGVIVQRAWLERKKIAKMGTMTIKTTKWRGFFLLGVLPIYIWVVDYEYF